MFLLITYDVSTVEKAGLRRLRRVAQACEDYGTRVQNSVFECLVGEADWVKLKDRLLSEVDLTQDSLRFYHLDQGARKLIEHYGTKEVVDLTAPLIL